MKQPLPFQLIAFCLENRQLIHYVWKLFEVNDGIPAAIVPVSQTNMDMSHDQVSPFFSDRFVFHIYYLFYVGLEVSHGSCIVFILSRDGCDTSWLERIKVIWSCLWFLFFYFYKLTLTHACKHCLKTLVIQNNYLVGFFGRTIKYRFD